MATNQQRDKIYQFSGNTCPAWLEGLQGKQAVTQSAKQPAKQPAKELIKVVEKNKNAFLTDATIVGTVNATLGKTIEHLKPGPVYECAVKLLFSSDTYQTADIARRRIDLSAFAESGLPESALPESATRGGRIHPDGYLREAIHGVPKGPVEVKGYSHHQTGTADEKNYGIVDKYNHYPFRPDEQLTVVLCGELTKCNKVLLFMTELYHTWLQEPRGHSHSSLPACLRAKFDYWKASQFYGFVAFDDLLQRAGIEIVTAKTSEIADIISTFEKGLTISE